jgi:hypothetical protein
MLIPPDVSEAELAVELRRVRDVGVPKLRDVTLPALTSAARAVSLDESSPDHVVVESLLRRAVARFGGGRFSEGAVALFGLDAGTRGLNSKERREIAAEAFERTYETFRKKHEHLLITEVATQILILCSEQHTRALRGSLERAGSPETSAMPPVWMERFAAYYRIWTPVSGLGHDLTAYRATMLEAGRPWDRLIGTQGPEDPGYSQDEQAEGYASFALYHYAHFDWHLRQFEALCGGQWLLSDAEAEQTVADAVYRIWWYTPWNERDRSYLRSLIADTPGQELHGFLERLRATDLGRTTEQEWHDWTGKCGCSWEPGTSSEHEYFPTARSHRGIVDSCELHKVVEACGDYLDLINQDWKRLADWYHLDEPTRRGVSPEELYRQRKGG